ncbi:hypothetical protein ACNIV1_24850, partial [Escherichia coli]
TEQYEGNIVAGESMLGGARMEEIFGRQHSAAKDESICPYYTHYVKHPL